MNFLPLGVNVHNRLIVVIGGGKVAAQKLRVLVTTSARIRVYAKKICGEIRAMPNLYWKEREYGEDLLEGAFLVYACTDDKDVNRKIASECRRRAALVNAADDPANCDFTSLALWTFENMTVAVSSDATQAGRSVRWRNRIRDLMENDTLLG